MVTRSAPERRLVPAGGTVSVARWVLAAYLAHVTRDRDGGENLQEQDGIRGAQPVEVDVTDELDLHTFLPRDVPSLIPEYLDECGRRGFRQVRIVHGKGKGVLRRAVHAALDRHPSVASYRQAEEWAGGWGATLVILIAPPAGDP